MTLRDGGTAIGALVVAAVHLWLGRRLVHCVPANASRTAGVLGIVVLPAILGTAEADGPWYPIDALT